eukprot:29424-Chlamydomonas_euryale.AAC.1
MCRPRGRCLRRCRRTEAGRPSGTAAAAGNGARCRAPVARRMGTTHAGRMRWACLGRYAAAPVLGWTAGAQPSSRPAKD